jgi:hypothetical protein
MPPETDNLKLQELYEADQADRQRVYSTPDAVETLRNRDAERRRAVQDMMSRGEVNTPQDLYHASVIHLHGTGPKDFLIAHRLSTIAAIKGHGPSRWMVCASFDRFLMSNGLPQVYGTQFEHNADENKYQLRLPIEDAHVLSYEKKFFNVPPIAERLDQLNGKIKAQG